MSYRFDQYDSALVVEGWENGVGDSPHAGISDMRNVNIISIPGEASVNFSTQVATAPLILGDIVVTGMSSSTLSFSAVPNLVNRTAIEFTNLGSLTGLALNTTYWAYSSNGTYNGTPATSIKIYSDYAQSTAVAIGGTPGGAIFNVISFGLTNSSVNVKEPGYFAYDPSTGNTYVQDGVCRVWSNAILTTDGVTNMHYWTYTGTPNPAGVTAGTADTGYPYGLVFFESYNTNKRYIFAFNAQSIDYFDLVTGTWTWGWKPSDATSHNLSTLHAFSKHEAIVAPNGTLYFCDGNWLGSFFQTSQTTQFDPTVLASYTYQTFSLLPSVDFSTCLAPLGNQILIGGKNNLVYVWDTFSPLPIGYVHIAESYVYKMVTVNTNTFIFVGNRGRIYVTNGTNAQLYKKVPDHISGTVEPYFTWGGATSIKNQLYFSVKAVTNDGQLINQYGGVWAIDLDTKAIRLTNKLSYGTYYGYASAIIPNFGNNPAGTGLYIGWNSGFLGSGLHFTTTSGSPNIISNSSSFTQSMVGSPIYGTGIPNGAIIISVTDSAHATLNVNATASSGNVVLSILANVGIDTTTSTVYTNSEASIDSDLIPIGTYQRPKDMTSIEYKLVKPLISGESVTIKTRLIFNTSDTGYTTTLTDSTVGAYSGKSDINFSNAQWVQFQVVINGTSSNPSYTRLKHIRILGLTGPTIAQSQNLEIA